MTIGDDGVASICMGLAHVGDPCERCGSVKEKPSRRELEHSLATGFIKLQKERNPAQRQAQWVELQRLAGEIERLSE